MIFLLVDAEKIKKVYTSMYYILSVSIKKFVYTVYVISVQL